MDPPQDVSAVRARNVSATHSSMPSGYSRAGLLLSPPDLLKTGQERRDGVGKRESCLRVNSGHISNVRVNTRHAWNPGHELFLHSRLVPSLNPNKEDIPSIKDLHRMPKGGGEAVPLTGSPLKST